MLRDLARGYAFGCAAALNGGYHHGAAKEWAGGGRLSWIGLRLACVMFLSALELFAEEYGRVHAVYCLRREDVDFNAGERQLEGDGQPKGNTRACW